MLIFSSGTNMLTQCINVELASDNNIEGLSLLSNIFAAIGTFMGETFPVTFGQIISVDELGELILAI